MPYAEVRRLLTQGVSAFLAVSLALGAWTSVPGQVPPAGKKLALLVGVNTYDKRGFRDLEYAERDIDALGALLQDAEWEVRILRGTSTGTQRATLANINSAIEATLTGRTKRDLVLVGLAGHGVQAEVEGGGLRAESFFCPADAEQGNPKTMLAIGKLFAEIERRGGGSNLILVDACREDPTRGRGLDGSRVTALPEGLAVLFGCRAGQKSYETANAGGGHGVFFHFVLQGLHGAAKDDRGQVTWGRLVEYVSRHVSEDAPRLVGDASLKQTPNLVANLQGASPVLRVIGFDDESDWSAVLRPVVEETGGKIHARIKDRFAADAKAKPFRVAVFPFGDTTGKITLSNHETATYVQATLNYQLGRQLGGLAKGRFTLLDKFGLAREFADAGVDPTSVSVRNPDVADTLAKVGIDAAVLGTINLEKTRVEAVVAFADRRAGTTPIKPSSNLGFDKEGSRTDFAQRLGMELWLRTGDSYRRATIVTTRNPESPHIGQLFAIIPRESTEAEFIIRLSNRGLPTQKDYDLVFGMRHPDIAQERKRLFGVALSVDGVNSIFQDLGDGEAKPAIVPPSQARRWVLGPPGHRIVPADNPHGYVLRAEAGTGHSVIDVRGFQKDDQHALSFKLAPASQSVAAEKVGIVSEIGVITAHFFGEKLPGDQQRFGAIEATPKLGTSTGRQVLQPVFRIRPDFYKDPTLTLRLFYRTSEDCPIPARERVVVQSDR
jgi:hypothetical protein